MEQFSLLQAYLAAKKRTAILIYALLFLVEAFLVAWLITAYSTTVLIIFLFAEAAWLFLLYRMPERLALQGAFSRPLEGIIREMERNQDDHLVLRVEQDHGVLREVIFENRSLAELFQVGDRIYYAKALAAPLLLNRRSKRYVCPLCGHNFPANAHDACPQCTLPLMQAEKTE
ncbi:MAG: hypothetical protein IJY20_00870 [Clostridia bacterium]|nr:hypothetical protein [Clostridia bacterium]